MSEASAASDDNNRPHNFTSFASLFAPISPIDHAQNPPVPIKTPKKRNKPAHPDPEAEVIALSPKTLMATSRFVCEICNKGFQRDQNLQLHRRGHNLPWKLKQKSARGGETKKKVYICPEATCPNHDPARALGDLTGIKKHYSRKHGEKKYKCDQCGKRYAVQADWKAHSKTCGSREYRCDCGTLFSRKDSFITHRAFCDALAEETARLPSTADNTATVPSQNSIQLQPFSPWDPFTNPNPSPNPSQLLRAQSNALTSPLPATALLQIASNMGPLSSGISSSNAGELSTWRYMH
ncbi:hypothetical protein LUZ63_007979 [Rhynchospora breviuscula]|uniref:Protein EARLY HEADING DATE 2 n=1 Tax=Rhynchospora breviuscula TaxID=2022672 RepID=A0A9Q0CSQ1_9POAL|nr:hypothetical protein LUZ63_007979 [Rhynchospora breviuscula]